MDITVDEVGDVRVVRIAGNLDTQTSPVTQEQLTQLIQDGATKILLDFEELNYISSSGLRVLLVAHKRLEGNSGQVRICNPNTMVAGGLRYLGLLGDFLGLWEPGGSARRVLTDWRRPRACKHR